MVVFHHLINSVAVAGSYMYTVPFCILFRTPLDNGTCGEPTVDNESAWDETCGKPIVDKPACNMSNWLMVQCPEVTMLEFCKNRVCERDTVKFHCNNNLVRLLYK